jgi:hypothetical protein
MTSKCKNLPPHQASRSLVTTIAQFLPSGESSIRDTLAHLLFSCSLQVRATFLRVAGPSALAPDFAETTPQTAAPRP